MSSGKRDGSELNQDNWNDDDKVEVARDFRKAPEEELSRREMKVARQSLPVDLSCSASHVANNEQSSGSTSSSSAEKHKNEPSGKNKEFSQQNYSCYTPPINSKPMNSYMAARDPKVAHSFTTQSTSYNLMQDAPSDLTLHTVNYNVDSPQYQPPSIPTYSAAINSRSMSNSKTHSTHSQQQISSILENLAGANVKTSQDDSDSNSWSGMDLTKRADEPAKRKGESRDFEDEGVSSSDSSSKPMESEKLK